MADNTLTPGSPYLNRNAAYTDDQFKRMMMLADLTGQEASIARQQSLAQNLRGSNIGGSRIDRGSQIGRGLSGVASAIYDYKADRALEEMKRQRQEYRDWLMGKDKPGLVEEMAPGQFSTADPKYG